MLLGILLACAGRTPPSPWLNPAEPASSDGAADLSAVLTRHVASDGAAPGAAAATFGSEGLRGIGAAGVRQTEAPDPVQLSDAFHLGSNTKAMTAAVLATLHEDGVLRLDTPLEAVWPGVHPGWHGTTLLDLLHHRSGLPPNPPLRQALALFTDLPDAPRARAEAARAALRRAPGGTPGTFVYSNLGYLVVGAAMEAATGESWEALLQARLFTPLGMGGCGFGPPPAPGPRGHRAGRGGALASLPPESPGADNPAGLGPAGTVHCRLADWAQFGAWMLRGARGDNPALSSETWSTLLQPEGDYAAGWLIDPDGWGTGPVYMHNGSNGLWYAEIWLDPTRDQGILVALNAKTAGSREATGAVVEALRLPD